MFMKFTHPSHKDTPIYFDDYEPAQDGNNPFVQMCPRCREKYAQLLEQRPDDSGSAQSTCYVYGCNNESDFYVDFDESEVEFVEDAPEPQDTYSKMTGFELADFLFDNLKPARAFSFYVRYTENDEDRNCDEHFFAMIHSMEFGTPVIVGNHRYGTEPFCVLKFDDSVNSRASFHNAFLAYLSEYNIIPSTLTVDTEDYLFCGYEPFITDETALYVRDQWVKDTAGTYAQTHNAVTSQVAPVAISTFAKFMTHYAKTGVRFDFKTDKGTQSWYRAMIVKIANIRMLICSDGCRVFYHELQNFTANADTVYTNFLSELRKITRMLLIPVGLQKSMSDRIQQDVELKDNYAFSSVRELKELLRNLPDNANIALSGAETGYLRFSPEKNLVCIAEKEITEV